MVVEIEVWWGMETEQKKNRKDEAKKLFNNLCVYISCLENFVPVGIYPVKSNQPQKFF